MLKVMVQGVRVKTKWEKFEDSKLIEALLDMVNLGLYKADNGFKPGFLTYLEEKLQVSLPNSAMKAKPNIESRYKKLKNDFHIVYDMLNGSTSGFGYDAAKKCVTAEDSVWETYLQSRPSHAVWREKTFPFYEELVTIFGKDRSTGCISESQTDILEEVQKEQGDMNEENAGEDSDTSFTFSSLHDEGVHRQKKKRVDESMAIGIKEATTVIASEIAKASQMFSKAIGVDAEISREKKDD